MKISKRDLFWIVLALVLIVFLAVKSVWLDPIEVNDAATESVVAQVRSVIDHEHDGPIYELGIVTIRIIDVKSESEDAFKGHYRKYLFGIFPIGDTYFSSLDE
jgi:hypothetical protein